MKKNCSFIAFLFVLCSSCMTKEKVLLWAEEFDGDSLDESYWSFELGDGCPQLCGWGNDEPQIYTETNHEVVNGHLTIRAELIDTTYTSTRIITKNKFEFKYGWIEARIKLPSGKGLWPAFWLLGANIDEVKWPNCGEIDIMEYVGKEPGMVFSTLHTADSFGNSVNTKKIKKAEVEDDFHVYAAHWTKEQISFYLDGQKFYEFSPEVKSEENWPFDQPFYVILNLAVGGGFGGPEIDDSIFPQEFVIDYIRIYKN